MSHLWGAQFMSTKDLRCTWVIPCYNEANRLPYSQYVRFLKTNTTAFLWFVNDGSIDDTMVVLDKLQKKFPDTVGLLNLNNNVGKAEAVRQGVIKALETSNAQSIGYLDADLSTSLEEADLLSHKRSMSCNFIFGSRILKLDNVIERKWYRFFIGRVVATAISKILQIEVYDTQCGCKVFSREWAAVAFDKPFLSRWLFDVELFFRLMQFVGKNNFLSQSREVPLKQWIDTADSRVSWSYGLKLWWDLFKIWKTYR